MAEADEGAGAAGILRGIFAASPRSEAELTERLAPVDPALGRRWLLARLFEVGAPPRDTAAIVGAFRALGLSAADVPELGALLLNVSAAASGRAVALALLSALDGPRAKVLSERLSPDDLMALNDAQLTAVIAAMPTTPARVAEIVHKLSRQPPGSRLVRLGQIERIRRRLAIPAALLYRETLGQAALGLDEPILEAIIEEGGEGARIRVAELWRASKGAEERGRWAFALSRLHQVEGCPAVEVPRHAAWIGRSAEGSTTALLSLESAVDGSLTLARAAIGERGSASGGPLLLWGKVVSLSAERERDELLRGIEPHKEAALADAGACVEAAAIKAESEGELSLDTFAAVCFFSLARRLEAGERAERSLPSA